MKRPVIILGAGGHAKVLYDICRLIRRELAGFVDTATSGTIHGVKVLGGDELLDDSAFVKAHDFALGVGDALTHRRLASMVSAKGGTLATLVHPSAILSSSVYLGPGTVVNAGAVINIDSRLGARCIVNTKASIDHDCVLGDGVQVCPGVTIAGGVTCGDDVFIGSGATILPMINIGAGGIIGAGSTVMDNVPEGVTAVGTPARFVVG